MSKQSIFVGLDVHAETSAVAVVQGRDVVRSLGIVRNTPGPFGGLSAATARWAAREASFSTALAVGISGLSRGE